MSSETDHIFARFSRSEVELYRALYGAYPRRLMTSPDEPVGLVDLSVMDKRPSLARVLPPVGMTAEAFRSLHVGDVVLGPWPSPLERGIVRVYLHPPQGRARTPRGSIVLLKKGSVGGGGPTVNYSQDSSRLFQLVSKRAGDVGLKSSGE